MSSVVAAMRRLTNSLGASVMFGDFGLPYLSTTGHSWHDVCLARRRGLIGGIEFGGGWGALCDLYTAAQWAKIHGVPMSAHNYCLPQQNDFVLNLSDPRAAFRQKSIDYAFEVVDFCAQFGMSFCSFHAGFACAFGIENFGAKIITLPPSDMDTAYGDFIDSLNTVAMYACAKNICVLFENNVVTRENLVNEENKHFLCAEFSGIQRVMDNIATENVFVLLDVGHLKVACHSLGIDACSQAQKIGQWVKQIHLHDNDGVSDQHLSFDGNSWFWKEIYNLKANLIIEQPLLSLDELREQVNVIQKCACYE